MTLKKAHLLSAAHSASSWGFSFALACAHPSRGLVLLPPSARKKSSSFLSPCRHGDFFTAILKTQPAMINDWKSRQWSKFFCLSVYVTMYLNDHQRDAFYSSLGMNTTQFNQHVIIETNKTTARIFPEVSAVLLLMYSFTRPTWCRSSHF